MTVPLITISVIIEIHSVKSTKNLKQKGLMEHFHSEWGCLFTYENFILDIFGKYIFSFSFLVENKYVNLSNIILFTYIIDNIVDNFFSCSVPLKSMH